MRCARKLLVGSLPLLVVLSIAFASEVVPVKPTADDAPISRNGAAMDSSVASTYPALGAEVRSEVGSTPSAEPDEDCWIVYQWTEVIHGVPHLCSKWLCKDGRTGDECVPTGGASGQ